MSKINCIIIEDEIPSADELNYILKNYNFINVVGIAQDAIKGLELIRKLNPQAVFLDINMPSKNGMDLAKEIKAFNENIEIIFITAYDEYAVKAFEIQALDYILKPFEEKFNGTYKLVMKDDKNTEIPISRGNVKNLKNILDI
ncbi:MAG: response regulator [Clostridium cochlearium]|uniref:response regulator n=1 Tax=Clostridium cochlearium TaxID=1494 RepID=UPI00280BE568|nr:response regulator [Clostridium cochlearium]MDU1441908.1 response regulator [Clostridium cochlearium]